MFWQIKLPILNHPIYTLLLSSTLSGDKKVYYGIAITFIAGPSLLQVPWHGCLAGPHRQPTVDSTVHAAARTKLLG